MCLPPLGRRSWQSPAEPCATLPAVSPGHAYISPGSKSRKDIPFNTHAHAHTRIRHKSGVNLLDQIEKVSVEGQSSGTTSSMNRWIT